MSVCAVGVCSCVAGTAGQTAPVYRAGFHPHSLPGQKHDCPFPIFSLFLTHSLFLFIYREELCRRVREFCSFVLLIQRQYLDTSLSHSALQAWGTKVSGSQQTFFLQSPLYVSSPDGSGGGEEEQSSWIGICHMAVKIANHHYNFGLSCIRFKDFFHYGYESDL